MRTRDVYASLRELVPPLVEHRDKIVVAWSDRADPEWRHGDDWVRAEVITPMHLMVTAGRGDRTAVEREHVLGPDLEPIARDIAELLNAESSVPGV